MKKMKFEMSIEEWVEFKYKKVCHSRLANNMYQDMDMSFVLQWKENNSAKLNTRVN